MAALAQSSEERVRVLYLLDINKSADDAADRVQAMYQKLGQDKIVIRMRSWLMPPRKKDKTADKESTNTEPDEFDDGENPTGDGDEAEFRNHLKGSDFTKGFLNGK